MLAETTSLLTNARAAGAPSPALTTYTLESTCDLRGRRTHQATGPGIGISGLQDESTLAGIASPAGRQGARAPSDTRRRIAA